MTEGGKIVSQSLLDEHGGNINAAYADLSERFSRIAQLLDAADRKRSYAYSRELAPPTVGTIDDVPNPISDEWVRTGVDA